MSPPWTHGTVSGEARLTWFVRPLRSTEAHCDEGQRERGATWFSPRAARGGGLPEVSRRQWEQMGDDKARWEGNTGVGGASRCEEWEGGVETVL
jgi:hypothetical protein